MGGEGLSRWVVQKGREVLTLEDEKLRKKLRENDLSGTELARLEGTEAWAPLHDYPVFAEEVPHTGDPAIAASKRQVLGLAAHLGIFVVVGCIVSWPFWMLFWGLFLGGHFLRSIEAATTLIRRSREPLPSPVSFSGEVSSITGPQTAEEALRHDPFVDELDEAIVELETALDRSAAEMHEPPDLQRIRRSAEDAHAKRVALLDLVDTKLQRKLESDLKQVRADADDAPDDRTAETYEAEARAIAERLAAMKGAFAAAERLRSRERALLHQLQGARLDLLRAGIAEEPVAPALTPKLDRLRGELESEAEVEVELARARRASNRVTV